MNAWRLNGGQAAGTLLLRAQSRTLIPPGAPGQATAEPAFVTPEFEKRAHVSLIGVWALFFCIFSGLFCGFLIAYFFPDEVVYALYGVSTERSEERRVGKEC